MFERVTLAMSVNNRSVILEWSRVMLIRIAKPILALILLLPPSGLTAQDAPNDARNPEFSGEWWNELCSRMDLDVENGRLSGSYWTGVGSGQDEEFELTGFVSGDLIAYSVNFGSQGSLTSWSGQHTVERGEEKIKTMWLLAGNLSSDEEEADTLWRSIWTGANTYTRDRPEFCEGNDGQ